MSHQDYERKKQVRSMRLLKRDDGCVYPYKEVYARMENFRVMNEQETKDFLEKGIRPVAFDKELQMMFQTAPVIDVKPIQDKLPPAPVSVVNKVIEDEIIKPEKSKSIALMSKEQIASVAMEKFGVVMDIKKKKTELLKEYKELKNNTTH